MRNSFVKMIAISLFFASYSYSQEICDNGIDDDGDGLIDCQDDDLANDCCCLDAWTIELGDDILHCEGDEELLDAGPGFVSYEWQDRSTNQTFLAVDPGVYEVTAVDTCGNTVIDSIFISNIPAIQAVDDFLFCRGDTVDVNDFRYTQEGTFTQTLISVLTGCDSILVLNFKYYEDQSTTETHVFC